MISKLYESTRVYLKQNSQSARLSLRRNLGASAATQTQTQTQTQMQTQTLTHANANAKILFETIPTTTFSCAVDGSALLYSSEGTHVHTLPQITAASSTAVAAAGGPLVCIDKQF